ncbi:hypothetical protein BH10PLA2_BH10PLA2_14550 [soil metagenome]
MWYRQPISQIASRQPRAMEVLTTLIGMELTIRQQHALERRLREARLPKSKTPAEYDFNFPKKLLATTIVEVHFTSCRFGLPTGKILSSWPGHLLDANPVIHGIELAARWRRFFVNMRHPSRLSPLKVSLENLPSHWLLAVPFGCLQ